MPVPTLVAAYEPASNWANATHPKTASVTVGTGDVLAVVGMTEADTCTMATPTGGSLVYTLAQAVVVASFATAYGWTAPSASGQTFTLSVDTGGANANQFNGWKALRFAGSSGVGASAKTNTTGAPSLNITTTQDSSALVVCVADFAAADGTTRTWRTVNGITPSAGNSAEFTYFRDAAHFTVYGAVYSDAGAAGVKTVGLSAPTGQTYSIAAMEITGTVGGPPTPWAFATLFNPRRDIPFRPWPSWSVANDTAPATPAATTEPPPILSQYTGFF